MHKNGIKFLLVQINEAHSSAWPAGLPDQPEPQKCFADRICRAKNFVEQDKPKDPFIIRVDRWDNIFDNKFKTWPDKYYLVDDKYKVLAKSEYGIKRDGLINLDCFDLLEQILDH
jgi:hypothetical protein